MAAISNNNLLWNNLPEVPLLNVFSQIDCFNDLAKLFRVNKYFHSMTSENSLWKGIAEKIDLPLIEITEENNARNQVRKHVLDMIFSIKIHRYYREPLPKDIAEIADSREMPSFADIRLLKDYLNARDIIQVWWKLSRVIRQPCPSFNFNISGEIFSIIKRKDFNKWLTQYQTSLAQIQTLDLNYNRLSILPSEITQLTQLQQLKLENNHLSTLPSEITQLSQLQDLDLNCNGDLSLPLEIAQLTQLRRLNLSRTYLSSFPAQIGQLTQLQDLNLSENNLFILPAEIGQLTRLQKLELGYNNFTTLPSTIGKLTRLRRLSLVGNQLSALPSEIGQLTQLTSLILYKNNLFILPSAIGQLTQLNFLSLSNNNLSMLPAEIGQLTRLETLNLRNNNLSTLPSEIGQLNFPTVNIEGNPLSKTEYVKALSLIYKKPINFITKAVAGISLATLIYYYPNEIISGFSNGLPYMGAIAGAAAIQKLVHRYFN